MNTYAGAGGATTMEKLLKIAEDWPNGMIRKGPTFGLKPTIIIFADDNIKIKLFSDGTWILQ